MEADGLDDFYELHRFKPSMEDAVTYFLPRLLAGSPLPHGADRLIHHADVYACEPKDLAAEHAPVPSAVSTGDRFFFTTCKHKSGSDTRIARGAGAGTWAVQKTENVYHEGAKVGELKHLSFKKGKMSTGWVMEEYRCLRPEALVAGGEKVLCKIHLAPNACAAARQESDAYKRCQERAEPPVPPQPEPVTVTASAHAQKRPAPVNAAADLSICKRMKLAVPVPEPEVEHEDFQVWFAPAASAHVQKMWTPVPVPAPDEDPVWFTPAAPVSLPTASTFAAEADDDMGRLSFSYEELLGIQQRQTLPIEAENIQELDIDKLAAPIGLESEGLRLLRPWDDSEWESEEQTFPIQAVNNTQQLVLDQDIDQLSAPRESLDQQRPWDEEEAEQAVAGMVVQQKEQQALPVEPQNDIAQLVASIDWEFAEELQSLLADHDEEEAEVYKRCSYNSTAPSLQGRSQFFSFGAVS